MKKILVTGGNGIIGNNIKDIVSNYNYEFIFINRSLNNELSIDLTNREDVLSFFNKHNFDYIIHLAADVGGLFKNMNNKKFVHFALFTGPGLEICFTNII